MESYYMKGLQCLAGIFLLCVVMAGTGCGPTKTLREIEDLPRQRQLQLNEAVQLIYLGRYEDGMEVAERVMSREPGCQACMTRLAGAFYEEKAYAYVVPWLEQAMALGEKRDTATTYVLAEALYRLERYSESLPLLESILPGKRLENTWVDKAMVLLPHARFASVAKTRPVPFEPDESTKRINTTNREYHPSLTADGHTLVFTRQTMGREDLFVSYLSDTDSVWSEARLLQGVNTRLNEGAHCISADGSTIIFTACGRHDGYGSCDLYISEWDGTQWTDPKNMGPQINSEDWESMPSLSGNGLWLYFSSNRRGGRGGNDIWLSMRDKNGRWTPPKNAGDTINTSRNEESPFIHPDNKTLYFMSDGHPGFGGQDLFMSTRDAYNRWTEPVNLGYPINTSAEEGGIVVDLAGGKAMMFSNRPADRRTEAIATDNFDIISFATHEKIQPAPVTYLLIRVRDRESLKSVRGMVQVHALPSDRAFGYGMTDYAGSYLICLPVGEDYLLRIKADGYTYYSDRFELAEHGTMREPIVRDVLLSRLEEKIDAAEEAPVVLENIFFETGSAKLKPSSQFELDGLAEFLKAEPDVNIQIIGHTDNIGTEEDNIVLSQARARSVYDALLLRGINASRLSAKGMGESQPIADNNTPEGRQKNRRTEFIILRR
jgi:outer membrane protein OmpA-like peptidoglycan-associated protein